MHVPLNVDEALLNEALELAQLTARDELINLALREFIHSRRKRNLLDLAGHIQFAPDFDHKILRETRHAAD